MLIALFALMTLCYTDGFFTAMSSYKETDRLEYRRMIIAQFVARAVTIILIGLFSHCVALWKIPVW